MMSIENDLPGISLKDEQRQFQNIIGIAQDNLDRAKESVKKLTDDLEVLLAE
jgi:DNA helicase II / ATP-dependent DNA helicase PcrA